MNTTPRIIGSATLYLGDCLHWLKTLSDNSIDSIVTDPPYGLSFMGKKWDYDVPSTEIWAECLRVLKPGGHLLSFAGTRTQHRMAVRIEDAGFEIRDMIAWVYGSGFPKSLNVAKAIESGGGRPEDIRRMQLGDDYVASGRGRKNYDHGAASSMDAGAQHWEPTTDEARQWDGWGTALKPALEPITVARKPLIGTVAANVLAHSTGAINIDGCRISSEPMPPNTGFGGLPRRRDDEVRGSGVVAQPHANGRWPANLIHDGSAEVLAKFPTSASPWIGNDNTGAKGGKMFGGSAQNVSAKPEYRDQGSAARFFYCAKASKKDRGEGNSHPTVKPTDLMAYLLRLVTPPSGVALDPFMGSGSTGKAAAREGFRFVGMEQDEASFDTACERVEREHAALAAVEIDNQPIQPDLLELAEA